jgi:hypothetical protein
MRQIFYLPLIVYLSLSKAQPPPACPPGTCGGVSSPSSSPPSSRTHITNTAQDGCCGLPCGSSACCSQFFQFCADSTGLGLCCENTQTYMDGTCCLTGTSCCLGNCTISGACQSTQAGCKAIGGTGTTCEADLDCWNGRTPMQRAYCVKSGAVSCVQGCCVLN